MRAKNMPPNQRFTFVNLGVGPKMEGVFVRAPVDGKMRFCAFMGFRLAPGQITDFESGPMNLVKMGEELWDLVADSIVAFWPPPRILQKRDGVVEFAAYRK